jgi:trehalose synthase
VGSVVFLFTNRETDMLHLDDFRHVVPDAEIADIYRKARLLHGTSVVHINSTYQGGGVAEILYSLIPLMNDVGIPAGWRILHGTPDFYEVTKRFHNALQGSTNLHLTQRKKDLYEQVNQNFAYFTHLQHDIVIVHDPQPLPMIRYYSKTAPWIWRCHIDLTDPHPGLYDYLKGFILKYDQMVLSSDTYKKSDIPVPQRIVYPAINPLSIKNRDLQPKIVKEYLDKVGIPTDKPFISQVSRLDPWKDPEGVLDVFELVREKVDCRLVLCYNMAADDPEGYRMYQKVSNKARSRMATGDVILVVGNRDVVVNAVQAASSVVIQKSIKEGFCLAVTEALWKARPVVASNVGGIPRQIVDGIGGFLVEPRDNNAFADRIVHLLKDASTAQEMGRQAKEHIRKGFLITRLLSNYLDMLATVSGKTQ